MCLVRSASYFYTLPMSTFKANLKDNSEYYSIRRMGMIVSIITIAVYGFISGMLPHFN